MIHCKTGKLYLKLYLNIYGSWFCIRYNGYNGQKILKFVGISPNFSIKFVIIIYYR